MTPVVDLWLKDAFRLIPSRYPAVGILDVIASPEDLDAVIELESWTNDRISTELGILHRVPRDEWVVGHPMSTIIMAAFCHPRPGGGRFNGPDRGAWYAALTVATAHAEVIHHRGRELAEIGLTEARLQMRAYLADFRTEFHDLRDRRGAIFDPGDYSESQKLAKDLLDIGSNGVIYHSVRHPAGTCIACFRPRLVRNVRASVYYEYRWTAGSHGPRVSRRRLG